MLDLNTTFVGLSRYALKTSVFSYMLNEPFEVNRSRGTNVGRIKDKGKQDENCVAQRLFDEETSE